MKEKKQDSIETLRDDVSELFVRLLNFNSEQKQWPMVAIELMNAQKLLSDAEVCICRAARANGNLESDPR